MISIVIKIFILETKELSLFKNNKYDNFLLKFKSKHQYVLVMLKSRPGFEAGPRPRPIWACQAQPETRPGLGLAEA